ncbi:hypothetical protein Z962_07965 [Clostridium botulinum C/D str. BKT12695]|nr:hypothetical protein Z962_07965 [Clostridium botulinum C/D str. BKT12695]
MYSFIFKNHNGIEFNTKDLGILINKRPPLPKPQRRINYIEIVGKNGTLTEDLESYKDIELSFECTIMYNVERNSTLINSWLDGQGDLYLNWLEGYKFKVKNVKFEGIDIDIVGDFTVTFVCDPFKYYIDNSNIEIKNPTIIYSPEFVYESEPVIKVYGSGNITLNINNNSIKLKDVQDYITLDSTIQECYKNNSNCNNKMQGEFPMFLQEENRISWNGDVQKIEIIPNWRCL